MVAIYIEAYVEYKTNRLTKQKIFIDSGAYLCLARKEVLTQSKWKKSNLHRTRVTGFNEQRKELDVIAENVKVVLNKTIFKIPIIYQENKMKQLVLLGNNFLDHFKTQVVTYNNLSLQTPSNKWIILKRILPINTTRISKVMINRNNNLEELIRKHHELLKPNFGENPVKLWDKEKIYAEIKLINSNDIVRAKPIRYSPTDQKEF